MKMKISVVYPTVGTKINFGHFSPAYIRSRAASRQRKTQLRQARFWLSECARSICPPHLLTCILYSKLNAVVLSRFDVQVAIRPHPTKRTHAKLKAHRQAVPTYRCDSFRADALMMLAITSRPLQSNPVLRVEGPYVV